jgi:aspartate aminotransferase, mitochondrial
VTIDPLFSIMMSIGRFSGKRFVARVIAPVIRHDSHWAKVPLAPADKILGLNEEFNKCTAANKVNVIVGAYRDDKGKPYVLNSVREAKRRIEAKNLDHEYAGIAGQPQFIKHSLGFAYGDNADVIKSGRVAALQTLSGTGACRLVGEYLAKFSGRGTDIYISNPTWGNHTAIMAHAGLQPKTYRYFQPKTRGFDFEGMLADVLQVKDGSAFLVHACAHNPTGCDPSKKQWDELSKAFLSKKHIVFFDSAYQGFASGDAENDAYSIRKFVADGNNIILGQSYAKNFGLYGERVGCLSVVTASAEETERVNSQVSQ